MIPPPPFPTVPHLPGSLMFEGDVALSEDEVALFLNEPVQVREKTDGINLTLFCTRRGEVGWQVKPGWARAIRGAVSSSIDVFVAQRAARLRSVFPQGGAVVVEWMRAELSLAYSRLPAPAVGFAVLGPDGRRLTPEKTSAALAAMGVVENPVLFEGVLGSLDAVRALVGTSQFGEVRMEGVVLERHRGDPRYAKWVREGYREPARSRGPLVRRNRLAQGR